MLIKKAVLKSFDPDSYTATVCISGSSKSFLEGIAVARNLPAVEMVPERKLAVAFFDDFNPAEAVIISVYT